MHIHIQWNPGLQRFIVTSPNTTVGAFNEEIKFHLAGAPDGALVTFLDNLKVRESIGGPFITELFVPQGGPTSAWIQGGDNVWEPQTSQSFRLRVTLGDQVAEESSFGERPSDPIIIVHPPLN